MSRRRGSSSCSARTRSPTGSSSATAAPKPTRPRSSWRGVGATPTEGTRFEIVSALGSFHGRTLATLTATGQEKVRVGFQPLPSGFRYVPYDDLAALDRALTDATAALLLEPILGEGGVVVPSPEYLVGARRLCDERGVLLMLDEIQVGMGRTGTLFAYEQAGIVPDVITLAKALASGIPIGACLAREEIAAAFGPGAHGSTFGGNAVAAAAAVKTLEIMTAPDFLPASARGRRISAPASTASPPGARK